jgi:hypothetical protein
MSAATINGPTLLALIIHALSFEEDYLPELGDVAIGIVEGGTVPLRLVGQNLGGKVVCRVEGEAVEVTLPDLDDLSFACNSLPEVVCKTSPMQQFCVLVGAITLEQKARGEQVQVPELARLFEQLCERDKLLAREAFRLVPRAIGVVYLSQVIPEFWLDHYYKGWREPKLTFSFTFTTDVLVPIQTPKGIMVKSEAAYLAERLQWSKEAKGVANLLRLLRASPSAAVREVIELETPAPEVEEPRPQEGEDPDVGKEVARSDRRLDPARHAFYTQELHCADPHEPTRTFRVHQYVAYECTLPSGAVVVFFDCKWSKNAAYAFLKQRPGETAPTNWLEYAAKTRWQLITLLNAGLPPQCPFLGRFAHSAVGDWRQPIRDLLAQL